MIKKIKSLFKKKIVSIVRLFKRPKDKVFVISFQKTGTTSTGKFFKDKGFKLANWQKSFESRWSLLWISGDYESIFGSAEFSECDVFEDEPWWYADFYKILYHRFPNSKFVLLERDSDRWYDSMLSHNNGYSLGNSYNHMHLYHRSGDLTKYPELTKSAYSNDLDGILPLTEEHRSHYTQIYQDRIKAIKLFFDNFDATRLFHGYLEDEKVWNKMGEFFNLKIDEGYKAHLNKTKP